MAGPSSLLTPMSGMHISEEFDKSGFIQIETLSGLAPTQLNGPIAKMFGQSKFPDAFDYCKMTTALKLPTQFTVTALPVFHSLFSYTKIRREHELDNEGQNIYVFPEPLDKLSPAEQAWTLERLNEMGEHLIFAIACSDQACGTKATCELRDKLNGLLGLDMCGTGSIVSISDRLYQMLVDSQSDASDIIGQQTGAFVFATTILHELGHAAVFASAPWHHQFHHFYLGESGRSTEMGFEITAWLFGGALPELTFNCPPPGVLFDNDAQKYSRVQKLMTIAEWPCPSRSLVYDSCGNPYATRGNDKTVEILSATSFLHVHKMFQDSFWAGAEIRTKGREALFFQRTTGYRFAPQVTMRNTNRQPILPHPDETFDLPTGFWMDKNGLIRRKVDKLAKMEMSKTKKVELQIRVNNIVKTRTMDHDWTPLSFGEKAGAWRRKVSANIKQRAEDTAVQVKETVKDTSTSALEKAKEATKTAGNTWELAGLNINVAVDMLTGKCRVSS
ncbi:hypothetical protein M409DRAFT_23677 [Zasmidium cellare ATCC 36951]|uniref:Uncharacterized protein n=1 Tax=Zasmidium cellare ATCC 36951 TaxID=1080233 RepID=A0A6A6CFD8_ZASCE|nr:uncharacterized protein M409DRAFT_23677 [Zasmidium cellare ATCC 36951]KAF2165947.1 hypothetical protein M409DRAFT_23677 [Zasmidium cellare ATCC 36951]